MPIQTQAPEDTEGGKPPVGRQAWFVNQDRSIWMLAGLEWRSGRPLKVGWFRPAASDIKVSGRRLDGPSAPLVIDIGSARQYPHRFAPSRLTFPQAGLWEIRARAQKHEARFVLRVL